MEFLFRSRCPDADAAACILQYDVAPTGGGTDVPVAVQTVVDVALVRPDAKIPEGRGVFGKATGERGDGERGRWGSDAYADSRISCGAIHIFDTAQHQ